MHLIGKNSTVHDEVERTAMQTKDPKYIIVVDQGSRAAPPIVDSAYVKSLLIDHHQSDVFPKNALVGYIPPTAPHSRQQSQIDATPGCVCMSLPTNSDLSPIDIRAMQATTSRYRSLMRLSLCHGHSRRLGSHIEMETPIPRYD